MVNRLLSENQAQEAAARQVPTTGSGVKPAPESVITHRVITRGDNHPPSLVAILIEQLLDTYKLEFEKVDPIRALANATEQKIETDEQLAAWTEIHNKARELWKVLDEARKNENRPLEQAVNETFQRHSDPLQRIVKWVKQAADDFNREKLRKQREEEAAARARIAEQERKAREDAAIAAEFGDMETALDQVAKVHTAQQEALQQAPVKAADVSRVKVEGGGSSSAATVWKFSIEDYSKVDLNAIRHLIPVTAIDKAIASIVKVQKGATKIEGVKVYEDVGTKFRK